MDNLEQLREEIQRLNEKSPTPYGQLLEVLYDKIIQLNSTIDNLSKKLYINENKRTN